MQKQDVESSVIGAVGHSRVLEIEFESGKITSITMCRKMSITTC